MVINGAGAAVNHVARQKHQRDSHDSDEHGDDHQKPMPSACNSGCVGFIRSLEAVLSQSDVVLCFTGPKLRRLTYAYLRLFLSKKYAHA
jgi:hypothetical protein